MKVKSIQLKDYKRFKDLRVEGLSPSIKLVLVMGTNGCGKSSLFEGFNHWYKRNSFGRNDDDRRYSRRSEEQAPQINFQPHKPIPPTMDRKKSMYFRTAFRHEGAFNISQFQRMGEPYHQLRINRLNQIDTVMSKNYQWLVGEIISSFGDEKSQEKKVKEIWKELVGDLQKSVSHVFTDLSLNLIKNPFKEGTFFFKKGDIEKFDFQNLSGGERSAFDLLLDLHLKKKYYQDTVFFIDEPETHMHTALQGRLIEELVNIINDESQLWITTHSLGVLQAAQKMEKENPNSVAILDFSDHDFDQPVVLRPTSITKAVWDKFLEITLGDYSSLIAPKMIFVCEGTYEGSKRKDFDASVYAKIFAHEIDISFVSGGNCEQLKNPSNPVNKVLESVLSSQTIVTSIIDRDDLSPTEVQDLESRGCVVLSKRNLESYLFDDEIVHILIEREMKESTPEDREAMKQKICARKNELFQQSTGLVGDFKKIRGSYYDCIKRNLRLTGCGNKPDTFLRDTLAPLVTPETQIYKQLYEDIIKPLQEQ